VAREAIRSVEVSLAPIWPTATLCSCLAVMRNGLTAPQNQGRRGCPVTRIETISGDRVAPEQVGYVEAISEEQRRKYLLQPGDILFSHINSEAQLGRSVRYSGLPTPLLHGMNLLLLRTNGMIDSSFLHYVLVYYRMQGVFVALASRSVNQSSINQGKLGALRVPLPPLAEQRAIAAVLDRVQHAIAATERVIAATRELKRSLMRHLFTYGPVPIQEAERVPLKETEIGLVPAHWEVRYLGEVADLSLGRTPSRAEPDYWAGGEVPWVAIGDLHNGPVTRTAERISKRALSEVFKDRLVPRGRLLLSFKLSIGKVGILAMDAVHNEAIVSVAEHTDTVQRDYLFYALLRADYDRMLDTYLKGKTLSKDKLLRLPLPVPPLAEQREIAAALGGASTKMAAEQVHRSALEGLFRALLKSLMDGRLRVPEVVQEVVP